MNKQGKKVIPTKPQPKQPLATGPFHFSGMKFHVSLALTIVALCFTLYGNSVSNGFSLDDEFVMRGDTVVQKGVTGIPQLFKMRYAWDQKGSYGYRPLVKASYAIEYNLFGKSPHAGHVINILMYAILCIFLFYFLRKLLYEQVSDYFLFMVMAIFIVHPMHTEVVDSLKNRDILLVTLFGFYCTYAFVKGFETSNLLKRGLWIISAMIAFDMAYLCKPDSLIFIAITPLILFFFDKGTYKSAALSVVLILIGKFALRVLVHHVLPASDYHRTFTFIEQPLIHTHWYERITLGFYSLWFYIRKLIFPVSLVCYYGYKEIIPQPAWTDINVIMGIIIAATLGYIIVKNKENRGGLMFTLLFFAGTMFAYVNIISVGPGIVAERFMFMASIGFVLLLVMLAYYLLKIPLKDEPKGNKASYLYMAIGLIGIIYSGRTIVRNPDWKSHLSIYEHDAKEAPQSAKLLSLLASAEIQEVQEIPNLTNDEKVAYYQKGEAAYLAAVDIYPDYSTSLNNLGMIQYNYYKNYNKAIEYFTRALKLDTNYTEALFNMGATGQAQGNTKMAEYYFIKTIKASPEYFIAYIYLSRIYFSQGRLDDIVKFNQYAVDHGHASDAIYVNLGNVALVQKDTLKAVGYFEKAVAYYSKNYFLCQFLTKYYAKKGDMNRSQFYGDLAEKGKEHMQQTPEHVE